MRLYGDLAPWFHLLTSPSDYDVESARYERLILDAVPDATTLFELGSGGGNNASFLCKRFKCTLSDLSPQMLTLSRALNPGAEHVLGDMRTLRLGRTFDAVFVHDAVMYMATEDDLRSCMETAFAHTRPGGAALFAPDCTRETFAPGTDHGGHDGDDGRALRYLEWTHEPGAARARRRRLRRPPHGARCGRSRRPRPSPPGLFAEHTWLYLLEAAGFAAHVDPGNPELEDEAQPVFVGRRPPSK